MGPRNLMLASIADFRFQCLQLAVTLESNIDEAMRLAERFTSFVTDFSDDDEFTSMVQSMAYQRGPASIMDLLRGAGGLPENETAGADGGLDTPEPLPFESLWGKTVPGKAPRPEATSSSEDLPADAPSETHPV